MALPEDLYFLPDEDTRVLPDYVRFAFKYRETKLTPKEVERLFKGGFKRLGFYLAMKAAEDNDPIQAGLLQCMAKHHFNFGQLVPDDIGGALEHLENKPERDRFVVAGKLGQVSRWGFRSWVEAFDTRLTQEEERLPDNPLLMVANSPYVGLDVLAMHSVLRGRALGILKARKVYSTRATGWFYGYSGCQ